jgi:hypothetical protein
MTWKWLLAFTIVVVAIIFVILRLQEPKVDWHALVKWPEAITDWALIATLFVFMWQGSLMVRHAEHFEKLAKATNTQAGLMEDTAKRQLRAYLNVGYAKLYCHADRTVTAAIQVINSGRTPAFGLDGAIFLRFDEYPAKQPGPRPDDISKSISNIGGNGGEYLFHSRHLEVASDVFENIYDILVYPDLVCCVNGFCAYKDIFDESHHLNFQMIVGGPAGIRQHKEKDENGDFISFRYDSTGNEST